MKIKIYDFLPREAMKIREKVFVEEQGFLEEFDEIDSYAAHLVLFDQDEPIAACRFFQEKEKQDYIVGRIAVIKEYRGQKIGAKVLRAAEEEIRRRKGSILRLHAQLRAKEFYEKQGYLSYGEIGYEEYCPHIWMKKKLDETI